MANEKPSWLKRIPLDIVSTQAKRFNLDWRLVAAICSAESDGDTFAMRYEPAYKYLFEIENCVRACGCTAETMRVMQMTSWGMMQVMGGTALGLGFPKNQYLTQLLMPAVGIEYGCRLLQQLSTKYQTVDHIICAYNAGSVRFNHDGTLVSRGYIDKVLRLMVECA